MAAIAKTAEAARVTKEAAAEVDQGAKGQEEKENPNQEFKRKEEERKQVFQSEAAQVTKNKEEEEKKSGMADKRSLKVYSSPRHSSVERSSSSPASVSSADTQEQGQKSKLVGTLKISKKLETGFDAAMGVDTARNYLVMS